MRQPGQRRGLVFDAVEKMFRLHAERFDEFDLRQQNVATAVVELPADADCRSPCSRPAPPAVNALVINRDFVVGHVIIHDHFFGADDDHLAHLLRVQPAHVDVRHDLAGIRQAQEDHVVNAVLHVGHAPARNRQRRRGRPASIG